jgi:hypothetical protein
VFSDTWPILAQLLSSTPKNAPILTYCTGGIRCVKVNAYLKQKLGFSNVGRLQKGIIAYEEWLDGTRRTAASGSDSVPGSSAAAALEHTPSRGAQDGVGGVAASVQVLGAAAPAHIDLPVPAAVKCGSGSFSTTVEVEPGPVDSVFEGENFLFDRRRLVKK